MFESLPLLSLQVWLPILGAIAVLISGRFGHEQFARVIAIATVLLCLVLCIPLYTQFDTHTYAYQFRETYDWIPIFHIQYDIGVDGISMPLVLLTAFTSLIVIIAAWRAIQHKATQYLATFLMLQAMTVGVFVAIDALLFYVFWEAMLIPMYLAIGIWGSQNRSYAAIKFFLYTFFGSALMLVVMLYLGLHANSFSIPDFYSLPLTMTVQVLIFIGFLLAFAVKVPMWPVHTWLPDAHTEAPAGGSVILAALMLKVGGYGFFRFSMPITPDASQSLSWLMIALSLIAIVYIGLIALAQKDMKRLIAYSSVAHMGFVSLGCFMIYMIVANTGNQKDAYMSLEGAMVQMISHAFGSGALFLGFGMLYERMHTRLIKNFGGIATTMPVYAALFMVFAMSNVGLPGTSGFVGEFMVILSAFKANFWIAFAAALTLIIGASYTLWMYKRVFYGEVATQQVAELKDVDWLEWSVLMLLVIAIFVVGFYPESLLRVMHDSIGHLIHLSLLTKL
ncbi:MAG: NADH-quinone oxidoreductase subunit M [Pseudomonadota bacterium]|nr:NADH-quinone oxidoreductase subunit M [Pseudomonadota bacterium]